MNKRNAVEKIPCLHSLASGHLSWGMPQGCTFRSFFGDYLLGWVNGFLYLTPSQRPSCLDIQSDRHDNTLNWLHLFSKLNSENGDEAERTSSGIHTWKKDASIDVDMATFFEAKKKVICMSVYSL